MDYEKVCFVIMPFGKKEVGGKEIDFDAIYADIFERAISSVKLPEGGNLEPRRTDKDFQSGLISQDMFEYIEYSRIALADITGLNANVFYELGHRHRARTAGTVIMRQVDAPIPFDINQIKAFMYQYQPDNEAEESRTLISRILTESLEKLRLDSPIRQALQVQQQGDDRAETMLREAEDAIRANDRLTAVEKLKGATKLQPGNPLAQLQLGLLLKGDGTWQDAKACFERAIEASPEYVEAYRELGIAENKLASPEERSGPEPPGLASLQKAVALDPSDFDAQSSMGGVLKRAGRLEESCQAYRKAADLSNGHPYPLLNALALRIHLDGRFAPSGKDRRQLKRAVRARGAQYENDPPLDPPWSLFDLALAHLLLGEGDRFIALIDEMEDDVDLEDWMIQTFLDTLALLEPAQESLPRLEEGIARLRASLE